MYPILIFLYSLNNMFNSIEIERNDIANKLLFLTFNKNDITHLSLRGIYFDINLAKLIANFISSDTCIVTHLDLSNNNLAHFDGSYCIADAMSKNKSIIKLNISGNQTHMHPYPTFDKFVMHLSISIKNHPCLKSINLGHNNLKLSITSLIDNLPISVTSINLTHNPSIGIETVAYILQNAKLKSLNLSNISPMETLFGLEKNIITNRSLLKLKYFWFCSNEKKANPYEKYLDNCVLSTLERNKLTKKLAIDSALCLISIRRFRRSQSGLLGLVPIELIKIIAKYIASSYYDEKWYTNNEVLLKRQKVL